MSLSATNIEACLGAAYSSHALTHTHIQFIPFLTYAIPPHILGESGGGQLPNMELEKANLQSPFIDQQVFSSVVQIEAPTEHR